MVVIVEYRCPHCGSHAVIPATRIEECEVAPCPDCGRPVRRDRGALATNWMVLFFGYAALALVPACVLIAFAAGGWSNVWASLLTGFSLGMLGAAVAAFPAYIYGYFFAQLHPPASTASEQWRIKGSDQVGAPGVCSICGTCLRGSEVRAGVCKTCQRKAAG